MHKRSKPSRNFISNRLIWLSLAVLVILAAGILIFRGDKKTVATIPSTNPASKSAASSSSDINSSQPLAAASPKNSVVAGSGSSSGDSSAADAAAPRTPYGNFVSNHTPGQNGSGTAE